MEQDAAAEIDWNSFVDFEYDPSVSKSTTEDTSVHSPGDLEDRSSAQDALYEDVAPFASLDFPSLDEWWADLPSSIEPTQLSSHANSKKQVDTPHSGSNSSSYVDWGSPDALDAEGAPQKKKRRHIPPEAKRLLTECFDQHTKDPYIPKEEMQRLVVETGLSLRQVQTFFNNARARKLPRPPPGVEGINIPEPQQQQGPMQRFLSSSPEDEGLSEEAVRAAANRLKKPIRPRRTKEKDTASIHSSAPSSTSNSSSASINSLDSRGSRKGRKRQREPSQNVSKTIFRRPTSPSRMYQCTFCMLDFGYKSDWKRHEESVHFPQREWICMLNGPLDNSCCVFCGLENADAEHFVIHKIAACVDAPAEQRTFQRKDKLVQHIKQVHGCQPPSMIKSWCRSIERNVLLLCGFCGVDLPDWKSRAHHLCTHFSGGIGMDMWLPELLGGIWPSDELAKNFVRSKFSATEHPAGKITCEACPSRFETMGCAALHRRQVHNQYSVKDRSVVFATMSAGHHSQRLINLAHQTSRVQVFRADANSKHEAQLRVGPEKTPTEMSRRLEARGFASPPHAVWQQVLHRGTIASPRAPAQNPLRPFPAALASDTRRPNQPGSIQRPHAALAFQTSTQPDRSKMYTPGPPVDAVRAILTNNRDQVENLDRPVQGMLHSLEQFEATEAPWPRPPGVPDE